MTKYISHAETNKLIRETLKAEFPGVKFSVKMSGGSTDISYEAPLLAKDVDAVVSMFEGRSFDGMQDLAMPKYVTTEGEKVHYGANYIHVSRHIPLAEEILYADYMIKHYSWQDWDGKRVEHPGYTIETSKYDGSQRLAADRNIVFGSRGSDLLNMVREESSKHKSFADFLAARAEEMKRWEAIDAKYQAEKAQEAKWEQALDTVIEAVETKATAKPAPIEINDYVACLIAAGWIDAA